MEKIKSKNEKLSNERQRAREKREEVEAKQKERKEKKETKQKKGVKEGEDTEVGDADAEQATGSDEHSGMHPARLAMMQKGGLKWKGHTRQRY